MTHLVKVYLALIPVFLAVDLLWLGVVANRFYKNQLGSLLRTSGEGMAPVWWAVAVVYLMIPLGIVLFALPPPGTSLAQAALRGAAYGVVLYAVYDMTNLALVRGWPLTMSIVDIAWGGVLCGSMTVVALFISRKFG